VLAGSIRCLLDFIALKFGLENPEITAKANALADVETVHQALVLFWRDESASAGEFLQELSRL
jgi:hypothetical protein